MFLNDVSKPDLSSSPNKGIQITTDRRPWFERHNPTAFSQADKPNTRAGKDGIVDDCPHIIYLCEGMCMMSPNSMMTLVCGPRKPTGLVFRGETGHS